MYILLLALSVDFTNNNIHPGDYVLPKSELREKLAKSGSSIDIMPLPIHVYRVSDNGLWIGDRYIDESDVLAISQAAEYYDKYIQCNPNELWAYNCRCIANLIQRNREAAQKDCDIALGLDPLSAQAWVNRAMLEGFTNNKKMVIEGLSKAVQKVPNSPIPYVKRGTILHHDGKFDDAATDFSMAIEFDSDNSLYYFARSETHRATNRYAQMKEDLTKAIELNPDYAEALNNRAWLLATCPQDEHRDGMQAIRDANRAGTLTEWRHSHVLDSLAAAYAEVGDFRRAIEWQKKTIDAMLNDKDKMEAREHLKLYEDGKPFREMEK